MRVMIVDDHSGFRRAVMTTLGLVHGMEIVGEASDGDTAVEAALTLAPDVILMDMSMPGLSGVDAMQLIHKARPDIRVVILTAHAEPALEREALAKGAAGFIAKGGGLQELVDGLNGAFDTHTGEGTGTFA